MHGLSFLPITVLILLAAVLVVAVFRRFHLSPVLGYFVAGAAIGEHGWFHVVESKDTASLSEFGVVFLLFAIGLELTLERLKSMRAYVFGFGGLQVVITSVIIGILWYFYSLSATTALVVGGGLALSSTAIVLQVLSEHKQQSTQVGRLSLAVLLMQDFAVVPLLVLVPLLVDGGTGLHALEAIGMALVKAIAALSLIFVLGRLLLRPVFRLIQTNASKNNELFIAATILIVLGSAWITDKMGLSLALGAFVAGLLVAETEYHLQAEESIGPFKGLLLGLFFMTVGMSFDISVFVGQINWIISLSLLLILIKAAIIIFLCIAFKINLSNAIHAGLLLSQGSEFAFILFNLAAKQNLLDPRISQVLMIVVTVTMALTPLLSMLGKIIADRLDKGERMGQKDVSKDVADLDNHVIIIGFGRVGKMVARLLTAEKVNYICVDISPTHVVHERREGFPIYAANGSKADDLHSLGLDRAKSVIITIDNEIVLKKCTRVVRAYANKIPIIVRAKDLSHDQELYELGASVIVPETYETGLQMGGAVLKSIGVGESEINRIKNQFRLGNYIMAQEKEEINDEALKGI